MNDNTTKQTEEVKTTIENQSSGDAAATTEKSETAVSVERSVEQEPSDKTAESGAGETKDENVNVSINQTIQPPAVAAEPNPNKNYEAAQPVVDPIV